VTTTPDQAFHRYLQELAEKARNKERWGAAHSKAARGELSGHWATPTSVLEEAKEILRNSGLPDHFALDVAASPISAVAKDWFGPYNPDDARKDALAVPNWTPRGPGSVWLNPPYSDVGKFAARAAEHEGLLGTRDVASPHPLLFLAFARTDTRWFHRYIIERADQVWLRESRIKFIDPLTGLATQSAPAPSFLALFGTAGSRPMMGRIGRWKLGTFR
jgi:hypothetical protein